MLCYLPVFVIAHTKTISRNAQVSLDLLQYTAIVVWIIFFIKYYYTRTKNEKWH